MEAQAWTAIGLLAGQIYQLARKLDRHLGRHAG
jgi:hypothetical protein